MLIALYCIGGFIAFIFLLAAVMPGSYAITAKQQMNCSPERVFGHVSNLNDYNRWNPWQKSDPSASNQITGSPQTVGHKYAWEGKKVGVGSLTLRKISAPSSVEFDLQFIKPWKSQADDIWTFEARDGGTLVTWHNEGPLAYPMARLMGPMIKKQLQQQFYQGLQSLKEMSEA